MSRFDSHTVNKQLMSIKLSLCDVKAIRGLYGRGLWSECQVSERCTAREKRLRTHALQRLQRRRHYCEKTMEHSTGQLFDIQLTYVTPQHATMAVIKCLYFQLTDKRVTSTGTSDNGVSMNGEGSHL